MRGPYSLSKYFGSTQSLAFVLVSEIGPVLVSEIGPGFSFLVSETPLLFLRRGSCL